MNTALSIQGITKRYGRVNAVNDVSFDIHPGEIFALLGPNGAGKTSIISCINTLNQPDTGKIFVDGHNLLTNPYQAKMSLGCVPQELIHHGFFPVKKILDFYSSYYGIFGNTKRIDYLLKRLELWNHRNKLVSQLSGGMKRRLLIAKALLHKPKLLLLDEPTAGVDLELKHTLWEFVKELKSDGTAVLLTTHYLEEAEQLSDRVGFLKQGNLIGVSPLKELMQEQAHRTITITLSSEATIQSKYLTKQSSGTLTFSVPRDMKLTDLLQESNLTLDDVSDIRINEGSLEDIFTQVIQKEKMYS